MQVFRKNIQNQYIMIYGSGISRKSKRYNNFAKKHIKKKTTSFFDSRHRNYLTRLKTLEIIVEKVSLTKRKLLSKQVVKSALL